MIDCKAFDALHQAAAEGALPPERRPEFDAHLAACPACLGRLSNYVVVTETLRRLEPFEREVAEAAPLPEGLVQRILASRKAAADLHEGRRTG
jgi:anti-sigma factor RsiW